ncbi:MAG: hypothetical protein JRJ87_16565 [Deltaproteobacteria bacterium]|nr:hypothetical protein [Deltaproteobacteria bacterium]
MVNIASIAPAKISGALPAAPVSKSGQSGQRFSEVMSRGSIGQVQKSEQSSGRLVGELINRIDADKNKLDQIIAQARAGKTFRPRELLAMQAEVYRISEELALVNKVVEEGMSSVKRVWNIQV